MFEVEINRVTFRGNRREISTIDSRCFSGVGGYEKALKFSQNFNKSKMEFYDNGYITAWKPVIVQTSPLISALLKGLDQIKKELKYAA